MGGDGDEWDDDWDARRWLFGMLGMACSERFGIFFQHSFGELKLDEIGRPGRGGGQKLNEVERCEKKWGGQSQRQAQVFLKENNCEMEMEKLGPREIRQTVTWWTILQTGQH